MNIHVLKVYVFLKKFVEDLLGIPWNVLFKNGS